MGQPPTGGRGGAIRDVRSVVSQKIKKRTVPRGAPDGGNAAERQTNNCSENALTKSPEDKHLPSCQAFDMQSAASYESISYQAFVECPHEPCTSPASSFVKRDSSRVVLRTS